MLSKLKSAFTTFQLPNFQFPDVDLAWPEFTADEWRFGAILTVFALLLGLEASFGLNERRSRRHGRSYVTNLGLFLLNDSVLSLLSVSSLWWLAEHYAGWGLLSGVENPGLKAGLSFILLDLTLYAWHWANHHYELLWMFHKVHHSDRVMNVSTAFRLHFGEVFLTLLVKALFIMVVGVDAAVVMANEAVMTLFVMFHHANLSVPGERWLSRLAIVPALHRAHHSMRRAEHDRNYGAVFSWWDRLFGTLAELEPAEIGLPDVPAQNLPQLLRFGFSLEVSPSSQALRAMIAEAAYFRAEKRGFAPGYEYLDWLEAEREIKSKF